MFQWLKNLFGKRQPIIPDPMKYLITGLGNPGSEYENTRHNIGFLVIDALAKEFEVAFKTDTQGEVTRFKHKGRTFILLKPSTYMNLSGKSVRYWLQKEKIDKQNLLVIVDDKNLDFGSVRMRGKGSDGGHNGLKSIQDLNGGNNYPRLRIGIGSEFSKGRQVDFVLGEWSDEEEEKLPAIIDHAAKSVKGFGTIGLSRAMSQYNGEVKFTDKKN